jgi:hypothetical protein
VLGCLPGANHGYPEVILFADVYRAILRNETAVTRALGTRSDSAIVQGQLGDLGVTKYLTTMPSGREPSTNSGYPTS